MRNFLKFVAVAAFILSIGASSIALGGPAGQFIDDATITTKVKAALLDDMNLKSMKVSVETTEGVVQLSGKVDTKAQEDAAIQAASRIEGVKKVEDQITVKTPTP